MVNLKRFFIVIFALWIFITPIAGVIEFVLAQADVYWFVVILQPLAALAYFLYIRFKEPFEVRSLSLIITVLIAVCALIATGQKFFDNEPGNVPLFLTFISLGLWLAFNNWFTKLPKVNVADRVNAAIPLEDENGRDVRIEDEPGQFKVLVFHMGLSDPYVHAQVNEYKKYASDFRQCDAHLIFISEAGKSMKKSLAKHSSATVSQWSDPKLELTKQLNLAHAPAVPADGIGISWPDLTPLPSVFILNRDNKIVYSKQASDYRKRPDGPFILRILEENHGKQA